MKYIFLLFGLLLVGCSTPPKKKAVDSLFLNGRDVYLSYNDYLEDYRRRTNAFPLIKREFDVFQQLFALTVSELPDTNGIPAVVSTGKWIVHHISPLKAPKNTDPVASWATVNVRTH